MIELRYIDLIRPDNFINQFKDTQEFKEWCYLGTIEDLEATLKEFAKYELYEWCSIIKEVKTELELVKSFLMNQVETNNAL